LQPRNLAKLRGIAEIKSRVETDGDTLICWLSEREILD
jgi:hypothetical protein